LSKVVMMLIPDCTENARTAELAGFRSRPWNWLESGCRE
jgi:hypothetical protein